MSSTPVLQPQSISPEVEQIRRDFLNAGYAFLSGLSVHDVKNAALQRPFQNLEKALDDLRALSQPPHDVELKYQEGLLTLMELKMTPHFSTVEAHKLISESMEMGLIESLTFQKDFKPEALGELFSKWALHCSVHSKPKAFVAEIAGLKIKHFDSSTGNLRVKSKQLLMNPLYALHRYYLMKRHAEEVFQGIATNQVISQKKLRRDVMEMVEIAKVAPYQIVALSLIRENQTDQTGVSAVVGQALATSLLSIVLAKELGFTFREQVNIGLIGALYNVGLLGEEAPTILKNDRLSPVEYRRVLDAQASGVYKLLKLQGSSRPVLERLLAIFEHSKGSQEKSVSLTLESRLLRLASQYVALTSERPFRDPYTPAEAVKILGNKATSSNGEEMDPILYYVFVRLVGVYPVGSIVLLSNGRKAVVFRPSGEKTGVPMVKLISEGEERGSLVDLAHEADVTIVKTLDPSREGINIPGFFFE